MFFGSTAFAAAPFADPGFNPNALVNVTGIQINTDTGTVGISADANFGVTGNQFNIADGIVVTKAGASAALLGNQFNLDTGTSDIDDVTVESVSAYYNTTHSGIESGDV